MTSHEITCIILVLCGAFSLAGGALNLSFFMNHRKARFMTKALGYTGARMLYALVGLVLLTIGILGFTGAIDLTST